MNNARRLWLSAALAAFALMRVGSAQSAGLDAELGPAFDGSSGPASGGSILRALPEIRAPAAIPKESPDAREAGRKKKAKYYIKIVNTLDRQFSMGLSFEGMSVSMVCLPKKTGSLATNIDLTSVNVYIILPKDLRPRTEKDAKTKTLTITVVLDGPTA